VGVVEGVDLPLTEVVVLALAAEGTTHGWALARTLAPDGEVGAIWTVHRSLVYRAVGRLTAAGLLRERGLAPGERGPNRTLVSVTARGRRLVSAWLETPVAHVRDMRVEFLVKLVLLHRIERERASLVARQREALAPIARQLLAQLEGAEGFAAVLARWRVESSDAALRFLDALSAEPGM
jgi:PadR family transcriptional regulator AphA